MQEDLDLTGSGDVLDVPRGMPAVRGHVGAVVSLMPMVPERDAGALFGISHGTAEVEALWTYLPVGPFGEVDGLLKYLEAWCGAPDVVAFTVRAEGRVREGVERGAVLGTISLMSLRPAHGVGELGNIWFCPAAQRTKVNTEANFLLLRHCFEELGYRRMEWKCNALNGPSRRAAVRLGFKFEGIFRQHMIVKGRNRDTAWFSMMDHEWPAVRERLAAWLESPMEVPPVLR